MPKPLVGVSAELLEHLEPRSLFDSSLSPPVIFQGEQAVYTVAAGDFDGDGVQDLAVASYGPIGKRLAFLKGNGDGTFESPRFSRHPHSITQLAAADFDADGRDELVVAALAANGTRSRLARVEFNDEVQKLRVTTSRPVPGFVLDVAIVRSTDGPTHLLYAVATRHPTPYDSQTPYLIHSIAFATPGMPIIQTPAQTIRGHWRGFRAADVNSDNLDDIVLSLQIAEYPDADQFRILTYTQSADPMLAGTFGDAVIALDAPGLTNRALCQDVDLDGDNDIVIANEDVLLYRGDGAGGFLAGETIVDGPSVYQGYNFFDILGFQVGPTGERELQIVHRHTVGGRLPSGVQALLRLQPQDDGSFVTREAFHRNNRGSYIGDQFQMVQLTSDSNADVLWLSTRHPRQVLLFTFDGQPKPPTVRDIQFFRGNDINARTATTGQRVKFFAIVEDPERRVGESGGITSKRFYLDTNDNGRIDAGDILAATRTGAVTVGAHWPRGTFRVLARATDVTGLFSDVACSEFSLTIL